MVTSSEASKFIYRDESVPPLTPFEVKVGVYNNKGDGPFSQIVVICSAEGGQCLYPSLLYVNIVFCHLMRYGVHVLENAR
jgi:receptor-type tyrosine-protein phosphatase gamma